MYIKIFNYSFFCVKIFKLVKYATEPVPISNNRIIQRQYCLFLLFLYKFAFNCVLQQETYLSKD